MDILYTRTPAFYVPALFLVVNMLYWTHNHTQIAMQTMALHQESLPQFVLGVNANPGQAQHMHMVSLRLLLDLKSLGPGRTLRRHLHLSPPPHALSPIQAKAQYPLRYWLYLAAAAIVPRHLVVFMPQLQVFDPMPRSVMAYRFQLSLPRLMEPGAWGAGQSDGDAVCRLQPMPSSVLGLELQPTAVCGVRLAGSAGEHTITVWATPAEFRRGRALARCAADRTDSGADNTGRNVIDPACRPTLVDYVRNSRLCALVPASPLLNRLWEWLLLTLSLGGTLLMPSIRVVSPDAFIMMDSQDLEPWLLLVTGCLHCLSEFVFLNTLNQTFGGENPWGILSRRGAEVQDYPLVGLLSDCLHPRGSYIPLLIAALSSGVPPPLYGVLENVLMAMLLLELYRHKVVALDLAGRATEDMLQVAAAARLAHDDAIHLTLAQIMSVVDPSAIKYVPWSLQDVSDEAREAILHEWHAMADLPDVDPLGADEPGQDGGGHGEREVERPANTGRTERGWVAAHWPPPLQLPEGCSERSAVPRGFLCSITHLVMTQPTLLISPDLSAVSTYERWAIQEWLQRNRRDPRSGLTVRSYRLAPNEDLRRAIEDWAALSANDSVSEEEE